MLYRAGGADPRPYGSTGGRGQNLRQRARKNPPPHSANRGLTNAARRVTVVLILESVKKLEELFIAPTARQILHETAQRAFARCECA